jgi:hypothetical protein
VPPPPEPELDELEPGVALELGLELLHAAAVIAVKAATATERAVALARPLLCLLLFLEPMLGLLVWD